jgi:hypothetical protein
MEEFNMNNEFANEIEKAYSLISQANKSMIDLWIKYELFTWRWWIGLSLTIIPWIAWILLRKKESTYRILFSGIIVMLISSWFDVVGILFGLWSYYYTVVPFSPAFIPWDFSLLPVAFMTSIQYKTNIKVIYKAIIFSVLSSFIIEPTFTLLELYNPKHWKFIYSLPIIFIIYLIGDWYSKRNSFNKI